MLNQFRYPKAKGKRENLIPNKKKTIPEKKENIDSDDDDVSVSDSSDSEYEELLIGDIVKKPDEVKEEVKEQLPPPLPLERQETKPVDIPKPKKKTRKTVVIKKYYQKKEPKEKEQKEEPKIAPTNKEVKLNYLGLPVSGDYDNRSNIRNHMTSKIFQW
jgi:hypothetical protein